MRFGPGYKTVYSFFLALFIVAIILSMVNELNSEFVLHYSIFGVVVCAAVWVIDSKIMKDAESMQTLDLNDQTADKTEIFKVIKKRIWLFWSMFMALGIGFIILFYPFVF